MCGTVRNPRRATAEVVNNTATRRSGNTRRVRHGNLLKNPGGAAKSAVGNSEGYMLLETPNTAFLESVRDIFEKRQALKRESAPSNVSEHKRLHAASSV